jgi:large subunit ribosomal protein L22
MEAIARLKGIPMSPRKMRFWADLIKGLDVDQALGVVRHSPQKGCVYLEKILTSGISNWHSKYGEADGTLSDSLLFVSSIVVDAGNVLKRTKPAPQGRAHRIRKRYNNVTLVLSSRQKVQK